MKKTASILSITLLIGTVALAQTSSTATRKSGKSSKGSDTASTQSASGAYGSQSADPSAGSNSAPAGTPASDNTQVKAGNSGFDDTSSGATGTAGQSDTQSSSASATKAGLNASPDSSGAMGSSSHAMQSGASSGQTISNGPVAETVGDTTVLVGWATHDAASNTAIKYGTNRADMSESAQGTEGSDGRNHHARLQGLQPNTRYYFQVTENGSPVGGVGTFKTTATGEAPIQSKAIIPQK